MLNSPILVLECALEKILYHLDSTSVMYWVQYTHHHSTSLYITCKVNKVSVFLSSVSHQAPSPAEAAETCPPCPQSGVPCCLRPGSASRHQSLPTDVTGIIPKNLFSTKEYLYS